MDKRHFLAGMAATLAATTTADAAPAVLRGTVMYLERIMLPPQARAEVKLVDISRADASAVTLARTVVRVRGGQTPFTLRYNSARIKPGRTYALEARITLGKILMYTTMEHHPAFDSPAPEIVVKRVADNAAAAEGQTAAVLRGTWLAEDIRGGGVMDRVQTTIEFHSGGMVGGKGGCNQYNGKATINGDRITFTPMASTMMACTPAVMNQEQKYYSALEAVRFWRIDATRRKLILESADRNALIIFSRK